MRFSKAHAYGNDFLYVCCRSQGVALDALARQMCSRHTGIGADGLIVFEPTDDGASMRLFNADGSRSEVSGNGVRGLAALLLRDDHRASAEVTIHTEGGVKRLVRTAQDRLCQTFRAAMGLPVDLRQTPATVEGETLGLVTMNFGNPQCVVLGPLPDEARFRRLGPALEHHVLFANRTNVEFAQVEAPGGRADLDLGARRGPDVVLRHRLVRRADCRRIVRRGGAEGGCHRAGRHAARLLAGRQRLPDRHGRSPPRRLVAPADSLPDRLIPDQILRVTSMAPSRRRGRRGLEIVRGGTKAGAQDARAVSI